MNTLLKRLTGFLLAATCTVAAAQDAYPSKPVRIVIPFPAGGAVDTMIRALSPELSTQLGGQPIVVDNRPGGGAQIGATVVTSAPADGYTVFAAEVGAFAINPTLYKKLSYLPTRDFEGVALLGRSPMVMYGSPTGRLNSLDALKKALAAGADINYGSFGPGTVPHILGHLLATATPKAKLTHVPYKGAPPAIQGMMTNEIDMLFDGIPGTLAMVRGGKAVPLAIAAPRRSSFFPDLPTTAEIGYPNMLAELWIGVAVAKGTPPAIVNRLNAAFEKTLSSPDMTKRFVDLGYVREPMSPSQFNAFIKSETDRYRPIIIDSGANVD